MFSYRKGLMKILQINTVYKNGGSTGRIAYDLRNIILASGNDAYVAYGYEFIPLSEEDYEGTYKMCSYPRLQWSKLMTRLFAHHGFYNATETKRLLKWIDKIHPDVIHLHNIHNHYIHVKMLFDYIKQHHIPVVWTLHDCWSFTGWCAYFDMAHCDKWKNGCLGYCPSKSDYPITWFSACNERNFRDKKEAFLGVENLTLVTPSQWLADLTRSSFLKDYPVEVINNGVDTNVFRPLCNTGIREKYGIPKEAKVILALMNMWGKRKGSDYLLELPKHLKNEELLVIVGLKKEQLGILPKEHCLGISRTDDVQELAALYSEAAVFLNPTLEDNFPTTNIEALSCGTPIVTFQTGGSVESVTPNTGIVVGQGDMKGLLSSIREVCAKGKSFYIDACREKAVRDYNKVEQYVKYIDLYKHVLAKK